MLAGPIVGPPGVGNTYQANYRRVFYGPIPDVYLPGGKTIDGTLARDPGNGVITNLRAGTLLGKVTATGFYANSVIGVLTNAEATGSTQIEVSVASAVEIVRRIGSTGTLTITGPPAASGTAVVQTATYSAVNQSTGAVTVTALGTNEVQTVRMDLASSGGTLKLTFTDATTGLPVTTGAITWSGTDATYLSNINTALDTATGVVGGIVATAISAVDTDLGFVLTFSGTGYARRSHDLVKVTVFPTTSTAYVTTRTTTGVSGALVAGSLVGPTDGSQTPITFIPDGFPVPVANQIDGTGVYAQDHKLPIGGTVDFAQLLPLVTDSGLKYWVKTSLRNATSGSFVFSDGY